MAPQRRPVHLVAPVWGARHVDAWLDLVLPSWLAAGNLPALARERSLSIVILGGGRDLERIASHGLAERLRSLATLRYEAIEDLIASGVASVTLTLAFSRGAALAQRQAENGAVVFLNADFLLADGSLQSLAARLDAGAAVVLAPSLRAIDTVVRPQLDRRFGPDGALAVASRNLVGLALSALHPTVTACRMDQPLIKSGHPNQFFWRVDEATLLCRSMLLFPLAIAPTRPIGPTTSFCDYGLVDQLAPESALTVLGDSDDWFALELSPREQEGWMVRPGQATAAAIARSLSVWTTPFHRAQVRHDVIIHACDPATKLAAVRAQAERFTAELAGRLGPAIPAAHHPYWVSGLDAWRRLRREAGLADWVAELGAAGDQNPPAGQPASLLSPVVRRTGTRLLIGRPGARRPWHPDWMAERLLRRIVRETFGARQIVLADADGLLARWMPEAVRGRLPQTAAADDGGRGSTAMLIAIDPSAVGAPKLDELTTRLRDAARGGHDALLVLAQASPAAAASAGPDLARVFTCLDQNFALADLWSLDDRLDRRVRAWHEALATDLHHVGLARRLFLLLRSAAGWLALVAANLGRSAVNPAGVRDHSGFVVIRLKARGPGGSNPAA